VTSAARPDRDPAVRAADRLQHDILDALADGVITMAADGRIICANQAAERLFGYSEAELAGLHLGALVPEAHGAEQDGYLRRYAETGNATVIGRGRKVIGRRSDGTTFPMHLAISDTVSEGRRIFTGVVRDITQMEAAQARLRDSFMLLFERSAEPMVLGDGTGRILDANEDMCRLLETPREQLLAARIADFLVGGVEENLRRRALREAQGAVSSTARVRTGSGREIDVRYWEVEFEGETGERRILIGATDLAPRHELERVTTVLRALFETSPDGRLVADEAGKTIFVNAAHMETWGLSEEDLSRPFPERWELTKRRLADPSPLARLSLATRDAPDEPVSSTMTLTNGRVVEVRSIPVFGSDGRRMGHSFITRDVTARARAEAELRASEERYRTLVSSLPVGVVVQYADGRIASANTAAEEILGLSQDQLLGVTSFDPRWKVIREDGSAYPPEEFPAVITLRTGKPCSNVLMGVEHTDGAVRWLVVNSAPLRRADGAIDGAVVSFNDITQQRLAEQEVARTRTAEAFRSLASGVAHKLNNSLTSIVGNAYLCRQGGAADADESFHAVIAAAMDASDLVKDLIALSGASAHMFESVNLTEVVRELILALAPAERTRVRTRFETGDLDAVVDPNAIAQAIMSVVRNALEAGDHVEIAVARETRDQPVPGAIYAPAPPAPGPYTAVVVVDDGPGIAEEVRDRLFQPFASTRFAGRGLGLAAAAGIMGTHSGCVEVVSSQAGCRVSLLLPRS